jgi:hypothetical protein
MTKAERFAVAILAGCPCGATLDALRARGIKPVTLDALAARGVIWRRMRTMTNPRGMTVVWYYLTVGGLADD